MNIIEMPIENLNEYENNPRDNTESVDKVAASIHEFGFKVPIIIDKDFVIIAGHTRLKAAKKLGLERVPCIVADDLTPEQVKAFRLADNKTSEFSEWDFAKLNEELEQLKEMEFDMTDYGFGEIETGKKDDSPESFEEYDDDLETKHKCPKCGYEW